VDGVGYKDNLISLHSVQYFIFSLVLFCCPLILDLCQKSTLICIAGNLEIYRRVASKLKLGISEDEYTENVSSVLIKSPQSTGDTDVTGQVKTGEQHVLVCVPIWLAVFFPLLYESFHVYTLLSF